jgi:hypothetical protein
MRAVSVVFIVAAYRAFISAKKPWVLLITPLSRFRLAQKVFSCAPEEKNSRARNTVYFRVYFASLDQRRFVLDLLAIFARSIAREEKNGIARCPQCVCELNLHTGPTSRIMVSLLPSAKPIILLRGYQPSLSKA